MFDLYRADLQSHPQLHSIMMGITALAWMLSIQAQMTWLWRQDWVGVLKKSDSYSASDVNLLDTSGVPSVLKGKTCLQPTVRPCPISQPSTLLHVHNSSWRFLWRHKSRANLAPSSWQRQLAFPLCSKAFYFRDTVTSSSSYLSLSLSHSGTACSLIAHHWITHLLDKAWLIKSFADLIKWKKTRKKYRLAHTSGKYMCVRYTPLTSHQWPPLCVMR